MNGLSGEEPTPVLTEGEDAGLDTGTVSTAGHPMATVAATMEGHRLDLRVGTSGNAADVLEADISSLSARLAVIRGYLLPTARRWFRGDTQEIRALDAVAAEGEHRLRGLMGVAHGQAAFTAGRDSQSLHSVVLATMERVDVAEAAVVARLDRVLTPRQAAALIARLHHAQDHLPTRPHPFTPRPPGLARMFFRASAAADRAMDSMDGRVLPRRRPTPASPIPPTEGVTA